MKPENINFRIPQFLLIVFLLCSSTILLNAQTKRAVIVAIGNYPSETKWRTINSENDIPLVQSALQIQGFKDFTILKNEQATKAGIVQAFKDLERKAEPGDILVLHFSSHGQRIADDANKDELDGYDEAIVTYNANAFFSDSYQGEEHLRDDEIEILVDALRRKVGSKGDVLMIADACHSGTISRSDAVSRGGMPPLEDPRNPPTARGQEDVGLFQKTAVSRGNEAELSPFVLISASQASQVNYEYQGAGSLSTAISRVAGHLNKNTSYRNFFAQLLKEMSELAPNQIPAIEGDIDRELFAGNTVIQEPYYVPYKVIGKGLNITGGTLNGLFEGTEIAVFSIGKTSSKEGTPLATGKIINAEGTWSKALIDTELPGNPKDYWIFVTKQTYGDIEIRIKLETSSAVSANIKTWLSDFSLVKFSDESPHFILRDAGPYDVEILHYADASVFADRVSLSEGAEELKEVCKHYAQGSYIKSLELSYPGINLSFEFIPVRVDENGEITDTLTLDEVSKNGVFTVNENIGVHIRVTNHGTRKAYYAIVDIQPDGVINGIIPDPDPRGGHTAEQFEIGPKSSIVIPDHKVLFGEPYGSEVFKLFATKEPIDFRPILSGLGTTRGEMNAMEVLFSDSYEAATRGGRSAGVSSSMEASTYSYSFRITPVE